MTNGITVQKVIGYSVATALAGSRYVENIVIKNFSTGVVIEATYMNEEQDALISTTMNIEQMQSGYVEIGYSTQLMRASTQQVVKQVTWRELDIQVTYPPKVFNSEVINVKTQKVRKTVNFKTMLEGYEYGNAVKNLVETIKNTVKEMTLPYMARTMSEVPKPLQLWGRTVQTLLEQTNETLLYLTVQKRDNNIAFECTTGQSVAFKTEMLPDGSTFIYPYRLGETVEQCLAQGSILTPSELKSLTAYTLMQRGLRQYGL